MGNRKAIVLNKRSLDTGTGTLATAQEAVVDCAQRMPFRMLLFSFAFSTLLDLLEERFLVIKWELHQVRDSYL